MRAERIPEHLRELRRDEAGRPVPYVNIWGDVTDRDRWYIAYDRAVGKVATYFRDDMDGTPDFTQQSPQRQRQCMVYGRCQVCTRPVDWGHRHLVLSRVSTELIDLHASIAYAVTEPWLCPDCVLFVIQWCPGLIRRKNAKDLMAITVSSPEEVQLVTSNGWVEGPYEQATKEHPVAMWSKVVLFNIEEILSR